MGSVTLIAVPDNPDDLEALTRDYGAHRRAMAQSRLASDPGFAARLRALLAQ